MSVLGRGVERGRDVAGAAPPEHIGVPGWRKLSAATWGMTATAQAAYTRGSPPTDGRGSTVMVRTCLSVTGWAIAVSEASG